MMSKFASIIVLVFFSLMSGQLFSKTFKLNPKESKQLTNNSLWTVNATCNIQASTKGKIQVSILKNKGKVNGRSLSTGQATSVQVRNNQHISVSAEPGTTVNLINLGSDSVEAVCSA